MKFRKARENDGTYIVDMVNALIAELGGDRLDMVLASDTYKSLITNPDFGAVLVVEGESGSIDGVCCLSYQTAIRTLGRYAIVQEMFVSPGRRGQNVGADLLRFAVATASSAGCRIVELGTPPEGDRQEKLYRSEGFDVVGLRMRKVLPG